MTVYRKALIAGAFGATLALGAAIGVAVADQPQMHDALRDLRQARNHLENATADKGGHRVAAIGYVDQAIHEVEEGIRFDRRH
jgi:hypothetical protein